MLSLLLSTPSNNPDYQTDSTQTHVSPDTETSHSTGVHSINSLTKFSNRTPQTASMLHRDSAESVQFAYITTSPRQHVAQTEPVVNTTNTPPSFKLHRPTDIATLINQDTQPTPFFTPTAQEALNDIRHGTAVIELVTKRVTSTLRWAATVALANQYHRSQGHGPLNLTNELSYKVHRNLSYGSAGTTQAH